MALHCPECGFANADGANYCQRCGGFLTSTHDDVTDATTASYQINEDGSLEESALGGAVRAPELVIRSGGGRAGERFLLHGDRLTIGRRPDSEVFLDDVTVSRDHAVLVRRGTDFYLDDSGSLNGTYVNRVRIESRQLVDGDELQVGKYKLAFLQH